MGFRADAGVRPYMAVGIARRSLPSGIVNARACRDRAPSLSEPRARSTMTNRLNTTATVGTGPRPCLSLPVLRGRSTMTNRLHTTARVGTGPRPCPSPPVLRARSTMTNRLHTTAHVGTGPRPCLSLPVFRTTLVHNNTTGPVATLRRADTGVRPYVRDGARVGPMTVL